MAFDYYPARRRPNTLAGIASGLIEGATRFAEGQSRAMQLAQQLALMKQQRDLRQADEERAQELHGLRVQSLKRQEREAGVAPLVDANAKLADQYPEAAPKLHAQNAGLLTGKVQPGEFTQPGWQYAHQGAQVPVVAPPRPALGMGTGLGLDTELDAAAGLPQEQASPLAGGDLARALLQRLRTSAPVDASQPTGGDRAKALLAGVVRQARGPALGFDIDVPATISGPGAGIDLGRRADEIELDQRTRLANLQQEGMDRRQAAKLSADMQKAYLRDLASRNTTLARLVDTAERAHINRVNQGADYGESWKLVLSELPQLAGLLQQGPPRATESLDPAAALAEGLERLGQAGAGLQPGPAAGAPSLAGSLTATPSGPLPQRPGSGGAPGASALFPQGTKAAAEIRRQEVATALGWSQHAYTEARTRRIVELLPLEAEKIRAGMADQDRRFQLAVWSLKLREDGQSQQAAAREMALLLQAERNDLARMAQQTRLTPEARAEWDLLKTALAAREQQLRQVETGQIAAVAEEGPESDKAKILGDRARELQADVEAFRARIRQAVRTGAPVQPTGRPVSGGTGTGAGAGAAVPGWMQQPHTIRDPKTGSSASVTVYEVATAIQRRNPRLTAEQAIAEAQKQIRDARGR